MLQNPYSLSLATPIGSTRPILRPNLTSPAPWRASLPSTADPAADAAALLRRLGFAILMLASPLAALCSPGAASSCWCRSASSSSSSRRRLDGGGRPCEGQPAPARALRRRALPARLVLVWCALSLVWTPFLGGGLRAARQHRWAPSLLAVAGYLALPDRMRSANLYILPVGVASPPCAPCRARSSPELRARRRR